MAACTPGTHPHLIDVDMAAPAPPGDVVGIPWTGDPGITSSVDEINGRPIYPQGMMVRPESDLQVVLRPNPNSPEVASWPSPAGSLGPIPQTPQMPSTQFIAGLLGDNGAVSAPPDTMGAIGPTQFVLFDNINLKSFSRTGVGDGVLATAPDTFWASVRSPCTNDLGCSCATANGCGTCLADKKCATSDPRIFYDRVRRHHLHRRGAGAVVAQRREQPDRGRDRGLLHRQRQRNLRPARDPPRVESRRHAEHLGEPAAHRAVDVLAGRSVRRLERSAADGQQPVPRR